MTRTHRVRVVNGAIEVDGEHVPTFSWTIRSDDQEGVQGVPTIDATIPVLDLSADDKGAIFDGECVVTYIAKLEPHEWPEGRGATPLAAMKDLVAKMESGHA